MPHANSSRKASSGPTTPAVIALHATKNCLVNLPASLVNVLSGANTPAQNVIVELIWKVTSSSSSSSPNASTQIRSGFAGWTGMQSKRRPIATTTSRGGAREEAMVEMDPAFARALGLTEGSKVNIALHVEPPMALTVHIEPLTPSDWEIIELHASLLELNLLSQIRALTFSHTLTVYISPTSTASMKVIKVEPEDSLTVSAHSSAQFAKLSPDAEVIVAPKTRQRPSKHPPAPAKSDTRSVGRPRRKSEGGGSDGVGMFFRSVSLPVEDLEEIDEDIKAGGKAVAVYLDPEVLESGTLRKVGYVNVTLVRPQALAPPQDPQVQQEGDQSNSEQNQPATKIVAKLQPWENAPDMKHVALSRVLANALDIPTRIGCIVRIEPAPSQLSRNVNVKIKVHPYSRPAPSDSSAAKWGGKIKSLEKEEGVRRLIQVLGKRERRRIDSIVGTSSLTEFQGPSIGEGVLEGPITDGLQLPAIPDSPLWAGGLVKLDISAPADSKESLKNLTSWFVPAERRYTLELSSEILRPSITPTLKYENSLLQPVPPPSTPIVGVDSIVDNIINHLLSSSSVLLAGPHLSGKSSILNLVSHKLRAAPYFYHVINPGPMTKFSEERVAVIKDEFTRWFMMARWSTSLLGGGVYGGAVVVLDDLERVVKAESGEPGAIQDSGRARQVAEVIVGVLRRFCTDAKSGGGGNVMVLGACSGKENVHSWMVSGRGFREVISLKGPNRDGRRRILEGVVSALQSQHTKDSTRLDKIGDSASKDLDPLEIAAQTDGYMPGDLVLLVGRARHEAVVRVCEEVNDDAAMANDGFNLKKVDFDRALKGFVPVGLRGVKLQTSGAQWKDIGGLRSTRQTLLETLEWPTKYAPIFANCPLRLRSGLLLYGYPGCGKTLLASAVAGECGLNFISVKGPEILNKYIGASEKSVRDLFERAQSARPCVLFFDEFDSIAPKRGHDSTGVTDRVVNQMLTQMDGAEGLEGVYVLAATSRPDLIDPALLRPGRLDKSLLCDLPDFQDRVDILRALGQGKLDISPEVSLKDLALRTEGYSGADLQAVLYNAHLEAIHEVISEEERKLESKAEKKSSLSADTDGFGGDDYDFFQFIYGDSKVGVYGGGGIIGGGGGSRILIDEANNNTNVPYNYHHNPSSPHPQKKSTVVVAESRSKRMAERAAMLAKLELLRKRNNSSSLSSVQEKSASASSTEKEIVIITWTHLHKSLATTRPSISPEERQRLKSIYTEFVGSRNGEMKSGEGSTEVGGRSSLM